MIEDIYIVKNIIANHPDFTQGKIAKELGYSLGKVNFVIATLTKKGIIKSQKFLKSKNKIGYR